MISRDKVTEEINEDRRRFLGSVMLSAVTAPFGMTSLSATPLAMMSAGERLNTELSNRTLASVKQVDAGVLNVGYAEAGPTNGPAVVLLHGWPYDIHCYDAVASLLAGRGYRVIVPYLRGFGTTQFLSEDTVRNAEQAVMAVDAIALMDALGIQSAIVGGCDWGSRTAAIMAALWPHRVKALVAVSGYLIVNLSANLQPLPPKAELGWWYQYYFATERGVRGYSANTYDFNKLIWQIASPKWAFDQATFDRTAASFSNPDHVKIVIHNYRWRLSLVDGEAKYSDLEQKLFERPPIVVPTVTIASDFDGAAADGRAYANKFTGRYSHRVLSGIGHNVPQEDPAAFAKAIVDVDGY
jgi:pimeloyl-ACP methyl ester carboxylesterase